MTKREAYNILTNQFQDDDLKKNLPSAVYTAIQVAVGCLQSSIKAEKSAYCCQNCVYACKIDTQNKSAWCNKLKTDVNINSCCDKWVDEKEVYWV